MKHEKELSVMKYAKGEMDVIKLREKSEAFQKKLLEVTKERDNAHANMKQLISDKAKYSQMYDNKVSETECVRNVSKERKKFLHPRFISIVSKPIIFNVATVRESWKMSGNFKVSKNWEVSKKRTMVSEEKY